MKEKKEKKEKKENEDFNDKIETIFFLGRAIRFYKEEIKQNLKKIENCKQLLLAILNDQQN